MPRFLKLLYIGGAALAVVALLLGAYEHLFTSRPSASLATDILLPLLMLVVIGALYLRRKRELPDGKS